MRWIAVCLLSALFCLGFAQRTPLKLKPGDRIGVVVFGVQGYDSESQVLSDGSVNGRGFGRLVVEGKTIGEVEALVRKRLMGSLKNPKVTVLVLSQQTDVVFVSGVKSPAGGVLPLSQGMNLRQLLASVELPGDADQVEARLFRPGQDMLRFKVTDIMAGGEAPVLKPNDVVAVMPIEFIRIWVTGSVNKPGQFKLPVGTDAYKAIAEAGGLAPEAQGRDDSAVILQRGPDSQVLPAKQDTARPVPVLESGDTIVVQTAPRIVVSVSGEVRVPGSFQMKSSATLAQALSSAGGVTSDALVSGAMVVRKGEVLRFNASPEANSEVPLQDGDVVFLPKNRRIAIAVGAVNKSGPILMDEKREYRLADVLSEAGGINANGALNRVYLGRAGADGKTQVTEYRLDKFLKDGDTTNNPLVQPGDVVLFGQKKGFNLGEAVPVINSALLIFRIIQG